MTLVEELQREGTRARIYRWAYRLLQNHHDALDATQAVLLKALAGTTPALERRLGWLRRVTVNHCIDQLRRRRPTVPVPEGQVAATAPQSPEGSERRRHVAAALARLTETQRLVLVAKVHDGETFETIAASMSVSPSTVKTHYLRALRKLRDALGAFED